MYPRSGKKPFATLPGAAVLGAWSNKYRTFWALAAGDAGCNIYELLEDGTNKFVGNIPILPGNPVTFRANGSQLLICAGGNVYVATGTNFFQPIISYTTGLCQISGDAVTWVSDDSAQQFSKAKAGDLFLVLTNTQAILTSVSSATDATHLTLAENVGNFANAAYQLGTQKLTGVMPEFVDGYFIVNQPETKTFWISQPEDGTTWNALDFGTKSGSVDNIASLLSFSGYLGLVGDTNSSELWGDSGNSNFPFQRVSGMTINMGTAAAWSPVCFTDSSVAWLMESQHGEFQVVMTQGGPPQRISNHALEFALQSYPTVEDAIGSTYLEGGHEFYRLDFPTANRTWEFDKTTGVWVELGVATEEDEVYGCDRGRYRVHVTWPNGKAMDLAGDYKSGTVWQISEQFTDDDGEEILVMRTAPHINTQLDWLNAPTFALDCELGTGVENTLGPDGKPLIPTVSLEYSDDGANTWTEAGVASLGRAGEYEGTNLTPAEQFDTTPNSQTNPQMFEPRPYWQGLGGFWIARTYKIKSTASALRAVYAGLAEISK